MDEFERTRVRNKLTGGTYWDVEEARQAKMNEPFTPFIIPVWDKNKQPYKDKTLAVKVSPDGVFMAVVIERDAELRVY